MSMSAPFDPIQGGRQVPIDDDTNPETELEQEEERADQGDGASTSATDEDEAGGGPVFRTPHAGDRLHSDELRDELGGDE